MKRLSSLVMSAAFIVAIGAALGLKANSSPKSFNSLQGTVGSTCTPLNTTCKISGSVLCGSTDIYLFETDNICTTNLPKKN